MYSTKDNLTLDQAATIKMGDLLRYWPKRTRSVAQQLFVKGQQYTVELVSKGYKKGKLERVSFSFEEVKHRHHKSFMLRFYFKKVEEDASQEERELDHCREKYGDPLVILAEKRYKEDIAIILGAYGTHLGRKVLKQRGYIKQE